VGAFAQLPRVDCHYIYPARKRDDDMARPTKPIISRERAAGAALAVIDTVGLDEFGLNLVAARLGVKAPSLYHHFEGKSELLAEVARILLIEGRLPAAVSGMDWREEIVRISLASWQSVLRHPNAAPLLLRFFPRLLLIDAYEHWAKVFTLNGVPAEWQVVILEGSEKLTFGSALFAAASRSFGLPPFPTYDNQVHTHLTAAIRAHTLDDEGTFVECLRAFLRGLPINERSPQ
jgi:AcrR family transcriptional regulator